MRADAHYAARQLGERRRLNVFQLAGVILYYLLEGRE
jgi:hypothetical protein